MPELTDEQLSEWERLANEATGGEWRAVDVPFEAFDSALRIICRPEAHKTRIAVVSTEPPYRMERHEAFRDAAFIAAARTAVPALIAAHKADRARIEALETALRNVDRCPCTAHWLRARAALGGADVR